MRKIFNIFFTFITFGLCLLNIHKPMKKIFNSKYWYTNRTCERCEQSLGIPKYKKNAVPESHKIIETR